MNHWKQINNTCSSFNTFDVLFTITVKNKAPEVYVITCYNTNEATISIRMLGTAFFFLQAVGNCCHLHLVVSWVEKNWISTSLTHAHHVPHTEYVESLIGRNGEVWLKQHRAVLHLSHSRVSKQSKSFRCWHASCHLSPLSCHLSSTC